MTFTIFLVDPRPFEDWRPALDEMFGGRFLQDLEYKANGRLRYTNYVFGLDISCDFEEHWAEGDVHCLVGGNHASFRFDTSEEKSFATNPSAKSSCTNRFTSIFNPGHVDQLLRDLEDNARKTATAAVPAGSYPP